MGCYFGVFPLRIYDRLFQLQCLLPCVLELGLVVFLSFDLLLELVLQLGCCVLLLSELSPHRVSLLNCVHVSDLHLSLLPFQLLDPVIQIGQGVIQY